MPAKVVDFDRPPVVETVLGVQFNRMPALANAHLARFWKALGDEWPDLECLPELDDQFETFDEPAAWGGTRLRFSQTPALQLRLQIKNRSGTRMLQVQNGRFLLNWLGHAGLEEYPRYSRIRPEFDDLYARFEQVLSAGDTGPLVPNQWEVTYVNHLRRGTVWQTPADWHRLLPSLLGAGTAADGVALEGIGGHWRFEIQPRRGRLHFEVQHGRLGGPAGEEALVLTLTARGPIPSVSDGSRRIGDGLDIGREAIVQSFAGIASSDARKHWGER